MPITETTTPCPWCGCDPTDHTPDGTACLSCHLPCDVDQYPLADHPIPEARNPQGEVLGDRCGDCHRPTLTGLPDGTTQARCSTCGRTRILAGHRYTGAPPLGGRIPLDATGADRHLASTGRRTRDGLPTGRTR